MYVRTYILYTEIGVAPRTFESLDRDFGLWRLGRGICTHTQFLISCLTLFPFIVWVCAYLFLIFCVLVSLDEIVW